MKRARKHLTYANVMSSIAVFLMLGGATAFAATKVGANEIKANSIKTGKIVKEAVTAGKLKNGAVTDSKIADGAVTTNKLADNAVTSGKIADNAVTTNKIAGNAVTNSKIADNAVINSKIANGAVSGNKIGAATVTRANISESQLLPRGYAFVKLGGSVDPAFSSNIPNGTNPSAGVFCFDLAFTPVHAQVSTEGDTEPNDLSSVNIADAGEKLVTCPAGSDVEVRTWDTVANALASEEFFLTVW